MSTTHDVAAGFAEIVVEVADGVTAEDVRPDQALRGDLHVDSLALVEIVVATEERFGIRIPDDDVKDLVTVGDYVDYVERVLSA